jgi:hypothetical protein
MAANRGFALIRPSDRLGSIPLFFAGDRPFTVDDAVAAAAFRGDLEPWTDEVLALLRADESINGGSNDPVDEVTVQEASEAFRYDRDLITAEETEEWLTARGLTLHDFSRWFGLKLRVDSGSDVETPEFPELLRIHLWMSDAMERLSEELSRRVAAAMALRNERDTTAPPDQIASDDNRASDAWLMAVGRDRAWLGEMMRFETAYGRLRSRAVTHQSRTKLMKAMPLSFTRVEIASLDIDSEDAAREFFLSSRMDGLSLTELASEMGFRIERQELWLDSMEESLQRRLLSAAEGKAVAPIPAEGRFTVVQLLRKSAPALTDPAVLARIDERLTDTFFSELSARHIRRAIPAVGVASR